MSSVRKFLFNESFDVDLPQRARREEEDYLPEAVLETAPPIYGEEELAAARAQAHAEGEAAGRIAGHGQGFAEGRAAGWQEGYERGRAETEATVQARIAGALERIEAGVTQLIDAREATNAERRDQPVRIALAITRKLMPELARRGGLAEVEMMIRSCLIELIDEPRLTVRVADDMADLLRERLETMPGLRGIATRLVVIGEAGMAPGDCRVEWAEGGMERDTARLLDDIEHIAARLMTAPAS